MSKDAVHVKPGKVYLVGAGPGDPELLTRKAASLLATADVVLHDDLVPQEILAIAAESALLANVGKRCGRKRVTQTRIHSLMLDCARRGMSVIRLKSGDPTVFGRAGEEIQALRAAGIDFEIVPGIGAASAAAAAAGISLTDRRVASQIVFASGHRSDDQQKSGYWAKLVGSDTTLVIYMPGPDLEQLARELLEAGLPPATACLAICQASRAEETQHSGRLSDLKDLRDLAAPTILIVGAVAQRAGELAEVTEQFSALTQLPSEWSCESLLKALDSRAT